MFHGTFVVDHLVDVVSLGSTGTRLELQEISQRGLGPLYLRAEDSFLSNVHAHEQVRIRQDGRGTFQPSQGEVRPGECAHELAGQPQRRVWRQRRRDEGLVGTGLDDIPARACVV